MEFRGEAERQIANLEENIAAHHNQVGKKAVSLDDKIHHLSYVKIH